MIKKLVRIVVARNTFGHLNRIRGTGRQVGPFPTTLMHRMVQRRCRFIFSLHLSSVAAIGPSFNQGQMSTCQFNYWTYAAVGRNKEKAAEYSTARAF